MKAPGRFCVSAERFCGYAISARRRYPDLQQRGFADVADAAPISTPPELMITSRSDPLTHGRYSRPPGHPYAQIRPQGIRNIRKTSAPL